jgi:hypothetical protein
MHGKQVSGRTALPLSLRLAATDSLVTDDRMAAMGLGRTFSMALVAYALLTCGVRAQSPGEVDLALVLAVDISNSMDPEEQELQRDGFVEAFRSSLVQDAIKAGLLGRIAVVYVEWAGSRRQTVVVPWTIIDGPASAAGFADRLAQAPTQRAPRTSISGAIDLGVRLLADGRLEASRQVIDISGDGANNEGRSVTQARDEALARGITINGLPIMLNRARGYGDVENLDVYYRDCVIGGSGAFMVPIRDRQQFAQAIKTKIVREIAGLEVGPTIRPAQAEAAAACPGSGVRDWERMRN